MQALQSGRKHGKALKIRTVLKEKRKTYEEGCEREIRNEEGTWSELMTQTQDAAHRDESGSASNEEG